MLPPPSLALTPAPPPPPLLLSLSLSQSIASCLFSSLRDTQHFSGRSGSWLRQGEAIKTTADWNRLREQQCKLKGAHVVEQGVNSNRLASWKERSAHTLTHTRAILMGSASHMHLQWTVRVSGKPSLNLSAWMVFDSGCFARFRFSFVWQVSDSGKALQMG